MKKRDLYILVLCVLMLLGEAHTLFPAGLKLHFYPCNPKFQETIKWYVKDIDTRLFIFFAFFFWYKREKVRDRAFAQYIMIFVIFCGMDFIVYLLNHSHSGFWYLPVYLPMIIYATYIIKKNG